ncbi:MAG: universal stress protein [Kiloniellaceae bacterium]
MSLATILAVIDGAPGSEAAMGAALQLGRRFSAHVDLLYVEIDVTNAAPVIGEGMSGAAVEQVMQSLRVEAQTRLAEARRLYERHCVGAKLPLAEPDAAPQPGKFAVSFRHVVGREAAEVLRRGRLSDVIVLARPGREAVGAVSATFDAALFDSGRPVLLVPAAPVERLGRTVVVAWNRSREAARAVGAALPLLAKAESVVVLTARETEDAAEPSELARYLGAHGIAARTWAFTPGPGPIGGALLGEADKAGADLMVMGAYGHSRLRELVLGGATRGVLGQGEIPVFMVH